MQQMLFEELTGTLQETRHEERIIRPLKPQPQQSDKTKHRLLGSEKLKATVVDRPRLPANEKPLSSPRPQLDETCCLSLLHARNYAQARNALAKGLMTPAELHALDAAEDMKLWNQTALMIDQAVTRATHAWSRLTGWDIWGWISEPAQWLKPELRAITIRLSRPSRSLTAGPTVFQVESDLRKVKASIPPPVILALQEHRSTFTAIAFLEPMFRSRGSKEPLRSLEEARYGCRPIDPCVVGWLGAGPAPRLPQNRDRRGTRARPKPRRSHMGSPLFLLAHWDD